MNREIKFRSWDGFRKRMITKSVYEYASFDNDGSINCFNPFGKTILMQYTGLKDKNGKEIYEGDILLYVGTNMSSMTVEFVGGCFVGVGPFNTHSLYTYINSNDFEYIEVIGNIHENPELL